MQFGEDPLDLDDAGIVAFRQTQQPLVTPAAHLRPHTHQCDSEPRLARTVWQRLAEFVECVQPCLDRILDAVLRYPAFQPQVGEAGAVSRLGKKLVGLVEQQVQ